MLTDAGAEARCPATMNMSAMLHGRKKSGTLRTRCRVANRHNCPKLNYSYAFLRRRVVAMPKTAAKMNELGSGTSTRETNSSFT